MAVNDDKSVIGLVEQEGLADPAQIRLALLVDLDAGANAGVNEEIVAEAAAIIETLEEFDVLPGNSLAYHGERFR